MAIGLSVGLILGFLFIALIVIGLFLYYRRYKQQQNESYSLSLETKETNPNLVQFSDVLLTNITLGRKLGEGHFRYPFFFLKKKCMRTVIL